MRTPLSFTLSLLALSPLVPLYCSAQTTGHWEHREEQIERRQDRLTKQLGLTPSQKLQLDRYCREHRQKVHRIKHDASLSPVQRQSELMQLHRQHEDFLASILSPAQKKRWRTLTHNRSEQID